ncbi:hypothetical protein CYMTET_35216 [Cymbomonas tetramitiformis]|uniref:Uncharacterized protein n=1 Tax=Cymbomonas tetramitiformis TaxID=36881 RepID=A0AAE0F9M4_9CHLO|nr:hypothetical protein CYMTET_35216 [Cymbomonas tetramitiformis]
MAVVDGQDMVNVSLDEFAESTLLLGILGGIILGALCMFCVSNYRLWSQRTDLETSLLRSGVLGFRVHDHLWTWDILSNFSCIDRCFPSPPLQLTCPHAECSPPPCGIRTAAMSPCHLAAAGGGCLERARDALPPVTLARESCLGAYQEMMAVDSAWLVSRDKRLAAGDTRKRNAKRSMAHMRAFGMTPATLTPAALMPAARSPDGAVPRTRETTSDDILSQTSLASTGLTAGDDTLDGLVRLSEEPSVSAVPKMESEVPANACRHAGPVMEMDMDMGDGGGDEAWGADGDERLADCIGASADSGRAGDGTKKWRRLKKTWMEKHVPSPAERRVIGFRMVMSRWRVPKLREQGTAYPEDAQQDSQAALKKLGISIQRLYVAIPIASLFAASEGSSKDNQRAAAARELQKQELVEKSVYTPSRLLSTALIHAALETQHVGVPWELEAQRRRAATAPWEYPVPGREFEWYVSAFKQLLSTSGKGGWVRRSPLFKLALLRAKDGSFPLSSDLATILSAGIPLLDENVTPLVPFSVKALTRSLPKCLAGLQLQKQGKDESLKTEHLWGTLLVAAYLKLHAHGSWEDVPGAAVSDSSHLLADDVDVFLIYAYQRHPPLFNLRDKLEEAARAQVIEWHSVHDKRIEIKYRRAKDKKSRKAMERWVKIKRAFEKGYDLAVPLHLQKGVDGLKLLALSDAAVDKEHATARYQIMKTVRTGRRGALGRFLTFVVFMVKQHPLVMIALVGRTEAFDRSSRILMQANTFVLMLFFCLWFFYVRASACCTELHDHLACPFSAHDTPCLGLDTCSDLQDARATEILPSELLADAWVCGVFPDKSRLGQLFLVTIMVSILMPVNAGLTALFTTAHTVPVPAHWKAPAPSKGESAMGRGLVPTIQAIFFILYGLFVNAAKFTKAFAMAVVAMINFVFQPAKRFGMVFKTLGKRYARRSSSVAANFGMAAMSETSLQYTMYVIAAQCVQPYNTIMGRAAFFTIVVGWMFMVWLILTFSVLIRNTIGEDAEKMVLTTWGVTLAIEQFGKEMIQILMMRTMVALWVKSVEAALDNSSERTRAWFEGQVANFLGKNYDAAKQQAEANDYDSDITSSEEDEDDEDDGELDIANAGLDGLTV